MNDFRQKKVYIAVLNQLEVHPNIAELLLIMSQSEAYGIIPSFPATKPISNNRNTIVQKFLATDCDYLMMIDSDVVPPPNILKLVDFDKDIITPLMFTRQKGELLPLFLKRDKDGILSVDDYLNKSGLQECDATGTGCIVIKRKVLEAVKHPFENVYDSDGVKTLGLDFNFCQKAKELGFTIWVHLDYVASHYYPYDLKDLYYLTVNYERQKIELATMKDYLKEKNPSLLRKIKKETADKQLIRPKM